MSIIRTSVVIPLYNQVQYTKQCVDSILAFNDGADVEIILVNNNSSDGTAEYLETLPESILKINNCDNKGYAGACNQGISVASAPWIIVMNNDVVVTEGWIDGLQSASRQYRLDCVTPGIREGALGYNLSEYAANFTSQLHNVIRCGTLSGICFATTRSVFDNVGLFDENYKFGQYEDADLFLRIHRAGYRVGTVGRSFIHHFGSVTQKSMGVKNRTSPHVLENKKYFIKKWKKSRLSRLLTRNSNKLKCFFWGQWERFRYGHSVLEKSHNDRIKYY